MQIEKGKRDYPLPEDFGEMIGIYICDDDPRVDPSVIPIVMRAISPDDGAGLDDEVSGTPTCVWIVDQRIYLWPLPARDFYLNLRYRGHVKEI